MMILVSTEGSQQARRNGITILSACWRLDSRKVIVVVFQELLLTLEVLRASGHCQPVYTWAGASAGGPGMMS
jgi:hypothetical protein